MANIQQLLNLLMDEGVYDRGVLKAFFMAGGTGSGKSYVAGRTTGGFGLKMVNSDIMFERGLQKEKMTLDMASLKKTDPEQFQRAMWIRDKAKYLTKRQEELYLSERLGLVIDGTGKDYNKIENYRNGLLEIGYDCFMIFVNTSLEVALERNRKRNRKVPENVARDAWQAVQNNIGKFQNLFGSRNFIIVDNNDANEDVFLAVWKQVGELVDAPVQNSIGRDWINNELEKKKRK